MFHILDSSSDLISPDIAMCRALVHPDERENLEECIEDLKAGKSTDSILKFVLPGGDERVIHQQTEVLCDGRNEIIQIIGTVHDITEYSRLEEGFMQAQKMEAVGAMVGGIAHEFNNILAGMTGHLYMAKRKAKDNPETVEHLNKVDMLASRAAEMIHQMLIFARKGVVNMQALGLNALVKEILKLHQTSVPEYISLNHFSHPKVIKARAWVYPWSMVRSNRIMASSK